MARYSEVGVLPLRLTPTRITSEPCRSRLLCPSSWASEKLIASILLSYSLLLEASEKRPTRWWDLIPSSFSSGATNVPNMSSSMPLQWVLMTARVSMFTSVVKTIGFWPSSSAVWLIWRTAWCALSTLSINGRRTWRGLNSNWARMALPKVSAVMPVPSEMKNTVRLDMLLFRVLKGWKAAVRHAASTIGVIIQIFPAMPRHDPFKLQQGCPPCMCHVPIFKPSGVFLCPTFLSRPPWSYHLKT
jgi:hypothetical protein